MRVRPALRLIACLGSVLMLPAAANAAGTPGWQTLSVPTGGFSVQLPTSWVDASKASPATLKKIESNPSLRSLIGSLNGSDPLKFLAGDGTDGSTYMDVAALHVGPTNLQAVAAESVAALKKSFHVVGKSAVTPAKLTAGSATLVSTVVDERNVKLAVDQYFLLDRGNIFVLTYSTKASLASRYRAIFDRSAKSFSFLPLVDLSGISLKAAQVGAGYKAKMIPAGNQLIGEPTLDLCNGSYPSETLRTGRLQNEYTHGNDVPVSNEVVTYVAGGAQQALAEVTKVLAGCTKPTSHGAGAGKVTTTISRLADPALPGGAVGLRIHVTGTSKGKPVQGNIIVVYQAAGNTLSGVYTYDNSGKTTTVATKLAEHAAIQSARNLKAFLLAS